MKKIQWGILGCGRIAETFAQSMEYCQGGDIIAGASRTPGKADKFCQKYNIPQAFTDYGDLLKVEEIDTIYVGTTHNFHHENVLAALDAGKHVLCEKPLAVNATQAREMVAAARSKDKFLMETGQHHREGRGEVGRRIHGGGQADGGPNPRSRESPPQR